MKYEMIFGDEKLFDGAPDDAEYAGWFCQETRWYMILNGKILFSDGGTWCTSDNPYLSADIAAMRRIIAEPKRWTREDKKAGRLPEVGCRAIWNDDNGMKYTVKIETAFFGNECAVSIDDEGIYFAEKFDLFPIETPAEKAQRLKAEWCAKAAKQLKNLEYTSTLTSIYDALLSGELAAPKGGE